MFEMVKNVMLKWIKPSEDVIYFVKQSNRVAQIILVWQKTWFQSQKNSYPHALRK